MTTTSTVVNVVTGLRAVGKVSARRVAPRLRRKRRSRLGGIGWRYGELLNLDFELLLTIIVAFEDAHRLLEGQELNQ